MTSSRTDLIKEILDFEISIKKIARSWKPTFTKLTMNTLPLAFCGLSITNINLLVKSQLVLQEDTDRLIPSINVIL